MGRILVVDDDTAVRTFVVRALTQDGHVVEQASDAQAALSTLDAMPDLSLLITDVIMPGMDGVALAHEVRRRRPRLPVLLMTGYAAGKDQASAASPVTHDLIIKPFSLRDICDKVASILRGDVAE
jgi:DNA-binding NtrC family response regulator